MANFCYDCTAKVFPDADPTQNDMVHGELGEFIHDICEGCGEGWFNWQGKKAAGEPYQMPQGQNKSIIRRLRDWIKSYRL